MIKGVKIDNMISPLNCNNILVMRLAICELISTTKCAKKQEIQEMDELFPFAGDIIAPKGSMQLFYAKLTR